MIITHEDLKRRDACQEARCWFRHKFPNGGELMDVIGQTIWDQPRNKNVSIWNVDWILTRFWSRKGKNNSYIFIGKRRFVYANEDHWVAFFHRANCRYWDYVCGSTEKEAYEKAVIQYEGYGGKFDE